MFEISMKILSGGRLGCALRINGGWDERRAAGCAPLVLFGPGRDGPVPLRRKCYSALEVQPCGTGLSVYSEPDN